MSSRLWSLGPRGFGWRCIVGSCCSSGGIGMTGSSNVSTTRTQPERVILLRLHVGRPENT